MIILNNTNRTFRFHEYTESGVDTVTILARGMRRLNDREAAIVAKNTDAQYRIATGEISLSGSLTADPVAVDDMTPPPPRPTEPEPETPLEVITVVDDVVKPVSYMCGDVGFDSTPCSAFDGWDDEPEPEPVIEAPKKRGRRKKGQ
jgi:hypothetical protein